MDPTPFERLCAEFCAATNTPPPDLSPTLQGSQGFETRLHDTPITILRVHDAATENVHALMEFGLPAKPDEAATWQALLDANFAMVSRFALCFSRDPQSGHVMLQFQAPLHALTGLMLLQNCEHLAKLAAGWRNGDMQIVAPQAAQEPREPASADAAFV